MYSTTASLQLPGILHPNLIMHHGCCRCMYGLLMLLPQSDAFKMLHARLSSVPTMALLKLEGGLGSLQEPDLPPQLSLSPSKRGKASRQQSLVGRNSQDAGQSSTRLIDFDQLLQSFQQRQVQQ